LVVLDLTDGEAPEDEEVFSDLMIASGRSKQTFSIITEHCLPLR